MINQRRRLQKLEEQIQPDAKPIIIDVVFVDAAKQPVDEFQVMFPMSGSPHRKSLSTG
jgi:hypothetical protein